MDDDLGYIPILRNQKRGSPGFFCSAELAYASKKHAYIYNLTDTFTTRKQEGVEDKGFLVHWNMLEHVLNVSMDNPN